MEQLTQLSLLLSKTVGQASPRSGMWGGVATWDRGRGRLVLLHSGQASEGAGSHMEGQCLDRLDKKIERGEVVADERVLMFLNKAPCVDYTGNRRNCLERVVRWARAHPSLALVVAFRRPCAVGALTERGSGARPDKEVWPLYKEQLLGRDLPANLTLVSFYREKGGPRVQIFKGQEVNPVIMRREQSKDSARKEKIMKKLELEFQRELESKNKSSLLKNKDDDIDEFDSETSLIQSFIAEQKSKKREKITKKKRVSKLKSLGMTSIPIVAY